MTAENQSFWEWSQTIYARAGVADILLTLQDQYGLDINIILACIWTGDQQAALSVQDLAALFDFTENWAQKVTIPMRAVRRNLKNDPLATEGAVKKLRSSVKKLELQSEEIIQHAMESYLRQKMQTVSQSTMHETTSADVFLEHYQASVQSKEDVTASDDISTLFKDLLVTINSKADPNA